MIEFAFFYFVLLAIIIALIFVLLLYTGYHTRTLAPSLLSSNYGVKEITDSYSAMMINDGEAGGTVINTEDALNFGSTGGDNLEVSFVPLNDDRTRKLNGVMTLLMTSAVSDGSGIYLKLTDNGNTVCDESRFFIINNDKGLTTIRLIFEAPELIASQIHKITAEIKSDKTIANNQLQVNSIYVNYY